MRSAVRLWWPSIIFPVAILIAFSPLWWSGKVLAFRDTLHFFYPLWSYIDSLDGFERWVPSWNPWDGFGSSVAAEPTSMIFYPPRLGLLLKLGSIEHRIGWFLVGHLIFAYFGWICCGRLLRWHPWFNQLAAWGYTLSGPVFFQIFNPPYLVGAAWLPWAMFGLWQVVSNRTQITFRIALQKTLFLAVPLAMQVLGGDAQSAYQVILLGCVFVVSSWVTSLIQPFFSRRAEAGMGRRAISSITLLVAASVLAVGLAAIQIAPTWNWLKHSSRMDVENSSQASRRLLVPFSDKRASGQLNSFQPTNSTRRETEIDGEANSNAMASKHDERLQFATQPWHWVTMIAPNFFGSFSPIHTRWSQIFPSDGRVWVPSLHVGTSVFLLFLISMCSISQWKPSPCDDVEQAISHFTMTRFSATIVLIAMLSSFDFGLYPIWSFCLPIYEAFRYPAKWTTFLIWGICAIVGSVSTSQNAVDLGATKRRLTQLHLWVGCFGGLVLLFHFAIVFVPSFTGVCYAKLQGIAVDRWCGAIDIPAAVRNLGWSGLELLGLGFVVSAVAKRSMRFDSTGLLQTLMIISMLQLWLASVNQITVTNPETLHSAVADSVQQMSKSESICIAPWTFGDWQCHVVKELCDRETSEPYPSLGEKQAMSMLGKLHLLDFRSDLPIRNLRADFTFTPRLLVSARTERHTQPWKHSTFSLDGALLDEKQVQFRDVHVDGTKVDFTSRTAHAFLVELPIFDDGGWRVVSPDATKINLAGQFVRVQIKGEERSVQLRYTTPLLKIGIAITLSSILLLVACIAWVVFSRQRAAKQLEL